MSRCSVVGDAHAATGWSTSAGLERAELRYCVAAAPKPVAPSGHSAGCAQGLAPPAGGGRAARARSPRRRSGRRWRHVVLWLVATLVAAGGTAGLLHALDPEWCRVAERTLPGATCEAKRAVHRTRQPAAGESTPSDATAEPADADEQPQLPAPPLAEQTQARHYGTIEVVDIGTAEQDLAEALRAQYRLARARGQELLVMLTGRRCRPCRGVDDSLSEPEMQVALDGVRLVRVDLDVFREEIDLLHMPRDIYPAFFLIDAEASPRDTIHGGEWGEDVAENIAPVLGAFVRGEHMHRRYQRAPTSRSLRL